jgi:protein TonB
LKSLWKQMQSSSQLKFKTMTSNEILKADLLDILFDNRNKQYGAYSLRKQYNATLSMALAITLSAILLLVFLFRPQSKMNISDEPDQKFVRVIKINPVDPVVPKPPAHTVPPPKPAAQKSYLDNMKLVQKTDPQKEIQPIEAIEHSVISATNVEGTMVPDVQVSHQPSANATSETGNNKSDEGRFVPLERSPEFPGGTQAWANFLNRYLQTPSDLEPGEKKTVLINFWVDADGSVTGFKVVQSGGNAFDNEVIRVLKKMPKWKPAMQNGHPVAVAFTQPVTFVGIEE